MVRALDPVFRATLMWLRCSHAKLIARLGSTTATWLTITYTARSLAETGHVHFFIQTMLGYNHNREERRSDHISESPAPAYCRPLSSRPVVLCNIKGMYKPLIDFSGRFICHVFMHCSPLWFLTGFCVLFGTQRPPISFQWTKLFTVINWEFFSTFGIVFSAAVTCSWSDRQSTRSEVLAPFLP